MKKSVKKSQIHFGLKIIIFFRECCFCCFSVVEMLLIIKIMFRATFSLLMVFSYLLYFKSYPRLKIFFFKKKLLLCTFVWKFDVCECSPRTGGGPYERNPKMMKNSILRKRSCRTNYAKRCNLLRLLRSLKCLVVLCVAVRRIAFFH